MRTRILTVLCAAAAMFTASLPASAHHAFGAEFDANRPVLLKGKIVKMEWVNPHTWIHIEIVKDDGTKEVWMVEGGSPNSLLRANARNVTFPDGRKLFLGSQGTGAPDENTFPADKAKVPTKQ